MPTTPEQKYINQVLRPTAESILALTAADGAIRMDFEALEAAGLLSDPDEVKDDRSAEGLPPVTVADIIAAHDTLVGLRDSLTVEQISLLNKLKVRSLPR